MKSNFYFISFALISLALISCQSGHRKPSSVSGTLNMQSEIDRIQQDINNSAKFNLDTCATYTKEVYQDVFGLPPQRFDTVKIAKDWKTLYQSIWNLRVSLRARLNEWSTNTPDEKLKACATALRDGFRLSRWVEDFLVENFSGEPQEFKAGEPKFVADAHYKVTPFTGGLPELMVNPKFQKFTIRSGDLIASRGGAYTSASIARIGDTDSQFSHLASIYVAGDGQGQEYTLEEALKNPRIFVLESFIESGSSIVPFHDYVQAGNNRNLVLRYTDALVAHRAAKFAFDYITQYRTRSFDANPVIKHDDPNHNVPYNFQMTMENPQNPKKLFCSQVAHIGFKNNNIDIPLFLTKIDNKLSLPRRLGIKVNEIFAPGDMEVDPRFELVAEYRKVRKMKTVRMKDMVLASFYQMMEKGYEFTPSPMDYAKSNIAWLLRQSDLAPSVKKKMGKEMDAKIVRTVFALDKAGIALEKVLDEEDTRLKNSTGFGLTYSQGLDFLEKVRAQDEAKFKQGQKSIFHSYFSRK